MACNDKDHVETSRIVTALRRGIVMKVTPLGERGVQIDHDIAATVKLMKEAADLICRLEKQKWNEWYAKAKA